MTWNNIFQNVMLTAIGVAVFVINHNERKTMGKIEDLESALNDLKTEVGNTAQRVLDKLNGLDNVPDADIQAIREDITALQKIAADTAAPVPTDHLGQPVQTEQSSEADQSNA